MLKHFRVVSLAALAVVLAIPGSSVLGQSAPAADEFGQLHFRSIGPATMSGRISDFAVLESNPATYFVGTAHGGVWKTTSNGALFEALFQDQGLMSIGDVTLSQQNPNLVWVGTGEANNRQSTSWGDGVYKSTDGGKTWKNMGLRESRHIGRIVIDPDDNDIVLVAAQGPLFGAGGDRGVFKTTDGGATWKQVLKVDDDTGASDLVMAPTDHRTLYASTYQRRRSQCCMNGGGPGSGIWKSTDGGDTWTRLTGGLPTGSLGRIGVDVYRHSANIVYANIEAEGPAGGGRGGGGGAGAAPAGRGAGAAGGDSGLYRSDDGGATWRRVNQNNPRPMYFSQVRIDPTTPDRVYMGGVGLHMTDDGGQTMATDAALVIHDDIHAIWIDPNNPAHIMIGGDGGVAVSYDMSHTWTQLPNLPLGLFYHVDYDMEIPYNVCGGLQDNYDWCGPSQVRTSRGSTNHDWFTVQGGDGFVSLIDKRDSRIVYSESQDGNMQRKNKVTGESKNIRPNASNVMPASDGENLRYNWDSPLIFSPQDPGTLLAAANRVFKSTDKGDSWVAISPDLTANANREEVVTMGVVGSEVKIAKNDGIANWPSIVSLAESPKQAGVYYTGTDDGVVSVSKDGGKTWQNVTDKLPGFPKGAWVSEVVPSRFEAGTVYVTADVHRLNDFKTYIWASNDFGATFRSLNGNLSGEVVKTLTEDPRNGDVLYVGTETGIFLTLDRGKSWRRLKTNLPTVRVDEITIHPRDNAMIVATHGRSVWILDHLEPIQEYAAAQAAAADGKLFSIPTGVQMRSKDDRNDEFWGHQFFAGENPPTDAMIQFYLKKAVGRVQLKITDAAGKDVRELDGAGRNQPGIQTICWDMRVEPLPPAGGGAAGPAGRGGGGGAAAGGGRGGGGRGGPEGIPVPLPSSGSDPVNPCSGGGGGGRGGGGFGGGGAAAPLVLPGTYTVALVIDGKAVDTKTMKVIADPALQMNDVQQKRYFDIAMDLHDMQRRGQEMTNALNGLYSQMTDLATKLPGMSNVPAAVKAQFDAANKEFDGVRPKFGVPPPAGGGRGGRGGGGGFGGGPVDDANLVGRAGQVKSQVLAFQEMPSDAIMKRYTDVKVALPKAIADANGFLLKAMTLSQALKKYDITLTVPAPIK